MLVPPNGWFVENPFKMDDFGVPHLWKPSYLHIAPICSMLMNSSLRLAKQAVSGLKTPGPTLHPMAGVINPPDPGLKCKCVTGMAVCRESVGHEHMHACFTSLADTVLRPNKLGA